MSLGTLQGAAMVAALVGSVSMVSILKAGDWGRDSAPGICCLTNIYITTTNQDEISVQHADLGFSV